MTDSEKRTYLKANRWIDVSRFDVELWEPQRRIRLVPMTLEGAFKTQQEWDRLRKEEEEKAKPPEPPPAPKKARTRKKK